MRNTLYNYPHFALTFSLTVQSMVTVCLILNCQIHVLNIFLTKSVLIAEKGVLNFLIFWIIARFAQNTVNNG